MSDSYDDHEDNSSSNSNYTPGSNLDHHQQLQQQTNHPLLQINPIMLQAAQSEMRSVTVKAREVSLANQTTTEWNVASPENGGGDGGLKEHWPSHLPRPPSMKRLLDEDDTDEDNNKHAQRKHDAPRVILFNANMDEGVSLVRVLAKRGLQVTAVVRVFTSKNAKRLTKVKGVTVKVADLNNKQAVMQVAEGCSQGFLVTKYWERFESPIEENMAKVVIDASSACGIQRLVLATFEDTQELRLRGLKSQISPTPDGLIYPTFDGMDGVNKFAKMMGLSITHMFTSYLDLEDAKKSLVLIRGENGRIVAQSHWQDPQTGMTLPVPA
jgi:hypothetical protein